jgi:hypothetical protein
LKFCARVVLEVCHEVCEHAPVEGVAIVLADLIPERFQGESSSRTIATSAKFHRGNDAGHHVVAHSHSCPVEVELEVQSEAGPRSS